MYRLKTTANFNVGGGISGEVIHDSTLMGKGTSESPLKVDQSKFAKPSDLNSKQDTLISGTNIKTINNQSILGTGNIAIEGGSGELSTEVKNAILDCFENVAWTSANGQEYYDTLSELFFPAKSLVSISAVFNQGQTIIYDNASLDSLKQYLTVTALYDDNSTETVTNYSLSGTLAAGTSTVTVTYQGKTTTFTVYVTASPTVTGIEATYTQGQTVVYDDASLDSLKTNLVVKAVYSDNSKVTLDSNDYTLSGTLSEGTSTITVTYSTFTTTFTVNVTARAELSSISAVFTQGDNVIYDNASLDDLKQYLTVTANYNNGTTETLSSSAYTLSGTLVGGTSTITVTYEGLTDTFNVSVTHYVTEGWLYHFENSLASSGTKDFGFTGVANYGTGANGIGKSFYHHVGTEGTASTDPLGIYATGLNEVPDLSGDFTISFWAKAVTASSSHPLVANKYFSDEGIPSVEDLPNNIASDWAVTRVTNGTMKYRGIRFIYIGGALAMTLSATDKSAINYSHAVPQNIDLLKWHHYALTRKNGVLRFFFDGRQIWSINYTKTLIFADQICLGNNWGTTAATATQPTQNAASDYVDDLYISETCKWISEFNPNTITY